jgi:hypothetical protein
MAERCALGCNHCTLADIDLGGTTTDKEVSLFQKLLACKNKDNMFPATRIDEPKNASSPPLNPHCQMMCSPWLLCGKGKICNSKPVQILVLPLIQ